MKPLSPRWADNVTGDRQRTQHITYLLVILCVALVLRIWRLGHGLPDFLEEAIPLKEAFEMWGWTTGRIDPNPHFFNYPSLVIYLHFALQQLHYLVGTLTGTFAGRADYWLAWQIDPTVPVVLGRLLGVVAELATVVAVWRIGERQRAGTGLLAAGVVALAAPLVLTARLIYVEPVMAALSLWAIERMGGYLRDGRRGQLVAAAVLVGLAAGAKYNAGLLVIPLAYTLWSRGGWRRLLHFPLWALLSLAVFVATSPFVLVDLSEFWQHFSYERSHMASGHLGTGERFGAGFVLRAVSGSLGWPALALLLIGVVRLAGRRTWRPLPSEFLVWWTLLPTLVSVLVFKMTATRYLVPVIPLLALAVSLMGFHLVAVLAKRWPRPVMLTALLTVLLLVPAAWRGVRIGFTGAESTQIQARRWVEQQVAPGAILVQEQYGARLRDRFEIQEIRRSPLFATASSERRKLVEAWTPWRSVTMPLVVSGDFDVKVKYRDGTTRTVLIFDRATDANQFFYDPGLLAGVDYFISSSAVRDRFGREDRACRAQQHFYTWLEANTELAASFTPDGSTTGPHLKIYRLPDAAGQGRHPGTQLAADWWRQAVPDEFVARVVALERETGVEASMWGVPVDPGLPAWSYYLRPLYGRYLHGFMLDLIALQLEADRPAPALQLASAVNAMLPADPFGAKFKALSLGLLGRGDESLAVLDRALDLNAPDSATNRSLRVEKARILQIMGRRSEALSELESLLADLPLAAPERPGLERLRESWQPRP